MTSPSKAQEMTEEARKLADRIVRIINPDLFVEYDLLVEKGTIAENGKPWAEVVFGKKIADLHAKADAILALTPSHEAGTQRNVAHEDCLNCHCSDESLCAGTEPRSRKMVPEIPFDPMDHHNALLCPYCNPQGLKFAESGTQDARVPKVRTNHHRNKEEAARLQALVTERYARDGAGTQEPVAGTARSTDEEALALVMNMLQWIADTALAGFKGDTLDEMTALSNINNTTRDMIDALAKRRVS